MSFLQFNPLLTPDIGLMFWTVVTFTLLLLTLRAVAWKPILTGLKNRELSIEKALAEAKMAREEVANLKTQHDEQLRQAREERDQMLKDARETRDRIVAEAQEVARVEGQRILDAARVSIDKEREQAFRELKAQVANLAIEAAGRIIRNHLEENPLRHEELVGQYLNEVAAAN